MNKSVWFCNEQCHTHTGPPLPRRQRRVFTFCAAYANVGVLAGLREAKAKTCPIGARELRLFCPGAGGCAAAQLLHKFGDSKQPVGSFMYLLHPQFLDSVLIWRCPFWINFPHANMYTSELGGCWSKEMLHSAKCPYIYRGVSSVPHFGNVHLRA